MSGLVLAGDIGGTKSNLALFEAGSEPSHPIRQATFDSRAPSDAASLLLPFLEGSEERPDLVVLGIAGPVARGKANPPNLSWSVDESELRDKLGVKRVCLVNDLVATAYGIEALSPSQMKIIQTGTPNPEGNLALIAAGTGLGEALVVRQGASLIASPSEGGHVGFVPLDEEDEELLHFLRSKYGRVSYERVVSGNGLSDLYDFETKTGRHPVAEAVARRMETENHSAIILDEALAETDPACIAAAQRFVRHYGAKAGDLALSAHATGGVYLGGGIAPKAHELLIKGPFIEAFNDKGRLSEFMRNIPIHVIMEPKTALYGAALHGTALLAKAEDV
jgi:glucokinase